MNEHIAGFSKRERDFRVPEECDEPSGSAGAAPPRLGQVRRAGGLDRPCGQATLLPEDAEVARVGGGRRDERAVAHPTLLVRRALPANTSVPSEV
eukprot:COSAG04_NODE_19640_length_411_cov_0.967949_1_plen_94_part_10